MTAAPDTISLQESLAAIVESSDDAIIGLTLAGVVTSWNPAAERSYGYNAAEMIGQRLTRVVPSELHDAERRFVENVAAGGRMGNVDTSRLRRDGGRLVVSLSLFPITDAAGRTQAIAAIERDVTAQRALEAQLLQAKRTEAVGRLAGGVAQEFNNINTAILGLVEFVAQDLPPESTAQQDLNEIAKQALRGSGLARTLLAFSARQQKITRAVSVDESLTLLEPLLQRLVGERGRLTLELSLGTIRVHADQSELELVLFELVLNASDAIGERGTISIATRLKVAHDGAAGTLVGMPNGEYAEIVVRDSGSGDGKAGDTLGFDTASTTTGERGHVGLGLAMAYGLVQQLGGYVAVSSPEPAGTEVCIFLPAIQPAEAIELPAVDARTLGGNETILVVEDEPPVRNVVTRGLRAHGYNVIEAQNGEDALAVADAYGAPIHLVISDVVMPQMDGRALFERLRNWYPRIRFLFVSGYTRGVIAGDELSESATGFLAKPFRIEELCVQVRRLLDHDGR